MNEEVQAKLYGLDRSFPQKTPAGELTFAGVLCKYFAPPGQTADQNWVSKGWNEDTQITYLKHYDERILPYLPHKKAIGELRVENYEYVIEKVREEKEIENEQALQHLRFIMHRVSLVAYMQGVCENDVLWGTYFGKEEGKDDTEIVKPETVLTRTKHSLTPAESITVYDALMRNPEEMSGEQLGLLIMFLTGLRNNEACALRFDDWKPMSGRSEVTCVWVYKSTISGSNRLKASGKTRNADRVLPVLNFLAEKIKARRAFLEGQAEQGALTCDKEKVGELPVVCIDRQYEKGAKPGDLSLAGRQLLRNLHFKESALAELDGLLHNNASLLEGVVEKDATTYLFRRNMATMLYLLQLSEAEIQYYIGHDVEDPYLTRNMFTNEDRLLELKQKLDAHPLNRLRYDYRPQDIVLKVNQTAAFRAEQGRKITVKSDRKKLQVYLSCELQELKETFRYYLSSKGHVDGEVRFWHDVTHGERTADVREDIYRQYSREEQRLQDKKNPDIQQVLERKDAPLQSSAPDEDLNLTEASRTDLPDSPILELDRATADTEGAPLDAEAVASNGDKTLDNDSSGITEADSLNVPDWYHVALMIGDSQETLEQAKALRASGFTVEQVNNTEEAIQRFQDGFHCKLLFVNLCGTCFDLFSLEKMPTYKKELPVCWYAMMDKDGLQYRQQLAKAGFKGIMFWPLKEAGLQKFSERWESIVAKMKERREKGTLTDCAEEGVDGGADEDLKA